MSNLPAVIGPEQVFKMAQQMAASKLFGFKTAEEAFGLMMIAQAEGYHPAIAARDYHVIQGKPTLKADAMLARFQAAGGSVKWGSLSDERAEATFTHPQGGTVTIDWTYERAKTAGLTSNPTWNKYRRAMLRSRVVSEGIRTIFPGVIVGTYTPEEIEGLEPEPQPTAAPAPNGTTINGTAREVNGSNFAMSGDIDPACPFKTSDERKAWLVDAKADLDKVEDEDAMTEWLETHGGKIKWLGPNQQTAMNNAVKDRKAYLDTAALDVKFKENA